MAEPTDELDIKRQLSHVRAALGALLIADHHVNELQPDVVKTGRGKGSRIDHHYQGAFAGLIGQLRKYEAELDA